VPARTSPSMIAWRRPSTASRMSLSARGCGTERTAMTSRRRVRRRCRAVPWHRRQARRRHVPGTQVQHHGGQELLHGLVATGMHAPEPLVGDPLVGGMLVHDVQRVMILEQHVRRVEDADHGQAPIGELLRLVRRPVLEERARLHAGHGPGSIGRGWFLANLEAPTALVRGAAPAVGRPRDGFRITRFPWRPLCEGVPDG
jgi:hypothetical protein